MPNGEIQNLGGKEIQIQERNEINSKICKIQTESKSVQGYELENMQDFKILNCLAF